MQYKMDNQEKLGT